MKVAETLALHGGTPVRARMLPYGKQQISDADVSAVVDVLRSDWLTTGPTVVEFERACAARVGARHAVAVSNGTAALHAAVHALRIGRGDEVIVTPMTFAASANCVIYEGATPVFADVDPHTLLIDPAQVARAVTPRTRAIVAVDYAGQPADYDALRAIADPRGIPVIADACHAIGAQLGRRPVGSLAALTCFSFHPVKHVTTGEGGMVTTDSTEYADRMRTFRNHGITTDHRQREAQGAFFYEMAELGYNYRLSDIHCALGISQLARLDTFVSRRRQIAARYDAALAQMPGVSPLAALPGADHAYHLYVVQLDLDALRADRGEIFRALRAENIGVNVHYIPVHLHPYYRETFHTAPGLCPIAEAAYERLLSLPMFPAMTDADVDDVVTAVGKVVMHYRK